MDASIPDILERSRQAGANPLHVCARRLHPAATRLKT